MTADIRTAAQREAERVTMYSPEREYAFLFTEGAVWAADRITPTREQLATIIDAHAETYDGIQVYEVADAILALMQELAEGGSDAGH